MFFFQVQSLYNQTAQKQDILNYLQTTQFKILDTNKIYRQKSPWHFAVDIKIMKIGEVWSHGQQFIFLAFDHVLFIHIPQGGHKHLFVSFPTLIQIVFGPGKYFSFSKMLSLTILSYSQWCSCLSRNFSISWKPLSATQKISSAPPFMIS